jgi:hypothetical protein
MGGRDQRQHQLRSTLHGRKLHDADPLEADQRHRPTRHDDVRGGGILSGSTRQEPQRDRRSSDYTLSPKLEFESDIRELTLVDTSKTAASVFGGFTFRPKLADKWTLLTRADLGGGEAFTWSAALRFEYRVKSWAGLMFGYHALGIDTGDASADSNEVEYDVTHYGPVFSLTLHWTEK